MRCLPLLRLWLSLACLAGSGWLLPTAPVLAAVSCSMGASPNINFGTVNGFSSGATSSAAVTWTCSNTDATDAYVTFCVNIGNGTGGLDGSNRVMMSGVNKSLDFQLYQDAARSQVWGSLLSGTNPTPLQKNFVIPRGGGSYNGSGTVYGSLPGGQSGIQSGNYTSSFTGNDAMVSGTYSSSPGSYPASCGTSSAGSFPFTVKARVTKTCRVSATALDFGIQNGLLAAPTDATTQLKTRCTAGLSYQIGLDNGQHALAGIRRMVLGTGAAQYDLYKDPGRTDRWGDTLNVDTLSQVGTGANQTSTVYGQVPAQPSPPPGTYTDTITISVYY